MNNKKHFFPTNGIRLVLCLAVLGTLTGCVGYVDGPSAQVYAEPAVFAVQDDSVYYPDYECYYSVSRHQYAYREGNTWVARSAPRGVSREVLTASPSVRMNFHDSPAQHHEAVARQYPKNWKPSGSNQGQNRKDDQRGAHGDNQGK
jgi:hypothetical protein